MNLDLKMAWRNIWRNFRRTVLTISAITFAAMLLLFMLSFQLGSYQTMINTSVKINAGHLQVQAEGYQDQMKMRRVITDPEPVGKILDGIPKVKAYTYRAEGFVLVSSEKRSHGAMVTGIDPERETRVSTIKSLIRKGEYLASGDMDQAIVGRLLARNLKVKVGDELTLLGQGEDGSVAAAILTVKGIFSTGIDEFDRSALHMPLGYFQDVFSMGSSVHRVVAVADNLADVAEIKKATSAGLRAVHNKYPLTALDWNELMPGLYQAISMDLVSGLIFWFLLIIVVTFSILNTFLMAIIERTREFGVMMALGTTPGRLIRLILMESTLMTVLGVFIGIVIGGALTWYFQVHGIDFGSADELMKQYGISGRMYPRLSLLSVALGPGLVLIITFLAALYPAFRIRRLEPVKALTFV